MLFARPLLLFTTPFALPLLLFSRLFARPFLTLFSATRVELALFPSSALPWPMPRYTSSPLSSLHTKDHHIELHLVQYGLKPEKTSNNLLLSQNTCLGAQV
jgi:hypothetical protein